MPKYDTPKRRRFDFLAALFGTKPAPPTDPAPPLSGFIHGESREDRLERIFGDASELLRRAYTGLEWSRRYMQHHGLGQRRWNSAYAMLNYAAVINPDGTLAQRDQIMARRSLAACRDHFRGQLRNGRFSLPF